MSTRPNDLKRVPLPKALHEPQPGYPYQAPHSNDVDHIDFSQPLSDAVVRHALANALTNVIEKPIAILAVQGPPGDGKTSTIEATLSRIGVGLIKMPASALSGENEGAPKKAFDILHQQVAALSSAEPTLRLAVVVDDADMGVLNPGRAEHTVNSGIAMNLLQSLTDSGGLRTESGQSVPIYLSGNDYSSVRASLLRSGRCRYVTHNLTPEERAPLVARLYGFARDDARIAALVAAYPDRTMSFWRQLGTVCLDRRLDAAVAKHGFDPPRIEADLLVTAAPTVEDLQHAAATAAAETARNFLPEPTHGRDPAPAPAACPTCTPYRARAARR